MPFFKHVPGKELSSPPASIPSYQGRPRFTTEEYLNSISVPQTVVNLGSVDITERQRVMPFGIGRNALLITEKVQNGSRVDTIQHVQISGVNAR